MDAPMFQFASLIVRCSAPRQIHGKGRHAFMSFRLENEFIKLALACMHGLRVCAGQCEALTSHGSFSMVQGYIFQC